MPSSLQELEQLQVRLSAEKCKRYLIEFVRAAWPIIVPYQPLVEHFAFRAVCDHLEAVTKGEIKNLIINVPPGMAKSTITAVLWPCWEWIRNPSVRWLFATYSLDLTYRDARRRRDLISEKWYRDRWAESFAVTGTGVEFVKNDKQGYMFSTSTGGQTTGWRGDRLVLDDPQDPKGAESDVKRESTIEWLTRTWPTRIDQVSKYSAKVLIQQRLHEQDATGLYLKSGDWIHLKIPLEYTGKSYSTPYYTDPRSKEGETISEQIYPIKATEILKKTLGPYGTAGQLQQEPAPMEGGLIKRAWIRHYERDEKQGRLIIREANGDLEYSIDPWNCPRFCTVDPAITEKDYKSQIDPDYTVMGSWAVFKSHRGNMVFLLDLIRERMEGPEIISKMKAFHKRWKFAVIGVETIAFQKMLAQYAKREGLPIREISQKEDALYRIDKDKTSRALSATPMMADGLFYVPEDALWLPDYVNELILFPNAAHDDQMDMTAYAVAIAQKLKVWQNTSGETGSKPEQRNKDDRREGEQNPWERLMIQP